MKLILHFINYLVKKLFRIGKIYHLIYFFSLKVSKYITHIKRLKNCKSAWDKYWNRVKSLDNKLKALLIQLPPSFKYNPVNLDRVEKMAEYLPKNGPTLVFEFRDNSWFNDTIYNLFKKHNLCLGGTAIKRPTKKYWLGNLPTGIHIPPKTSDATYLRIHGEKGYKKSYSNQKLSEMKREVVQNKTNKNFIMFNNTFFAKRNKTCKIGTKKIRYAAVCNAVQFAKKNKKKQEKIRKHHIHIQFLSIFLLFIKKIEILF